MIRVVFSTRKGPFSLIIRAMTFSRWSHVCLLNEETGEVCEAIYPRVRVIRFADWLNEQKRMEIGPAVNRAAWNFATGRAGQRYDVLALFGLAFRKYWNSPGKWFCSELVAASLSTKRRIFRDDVSRITPEMLYRLHPEIYGE